MSEEKSKVPQTDGSKPNVNESGKWRNLGSEIDIKGNSPIIDRTNPENPPSGE